MKKMDKAQSTETGDFAYRGLYKAGAIAALMAAVLFLRNLDAEWSFASRGFQRRWCTS